MMKKIFILALAALMMSFDACKDKPSDKVKSSNVEEAAKTFEQNKKMPEMSFEKSEIDFGKIKRGVPVETTFVFTNIGTAPLVITDTKSSCGCTVPSKPEKPIAPGQKGEIKVRYNASGSGQITKLITVSSNTETGKEVLKIKAFVEEK